MRGISTSAKRGRIGILAVKSRRLYVVRNVGQCVGQCVGQLGVWGHRGSFGVVRMAVKQLTSSYHALYDLTSATHRTHTQNTRSMEERSR